MNKRINESHYHSNWLLGINKDKSQIQDYWDEEYKEILKQNDMFQKAVFAEEKHKWHK